MIKNVKRGKEKPVYGGIKFDSELELRYYRDVLEPAFDRGHISALEIQPVVHLADAIRYRGKKLQPVKYMLDFRFVAPCGREIWIDVKGYATEMHKLKRRLFISKYPDRHMYWVCYSKMDGGWIEHDTLQAARRKRKKEAKEWKENLTHS